MFRFTIRDVLWLMLVVGLAIGWGMDSRIRTHQSAETEERDDRLRMSNFMLERENLAQREDDRH